MQRRIVDTTTACMAPQQTSACFLPLSRPPAHANFQETTPLQAYIALVLSGWNLTIYYCRCLPFPHLAGRDSIASVHCTELRPACEEARKDEARRGREPIYASSILQHSDVVVWRCRLQCHASETKRGSPPTRYHHRSTTLMFARRKSTERNYLPQLMLSSSFILSLQAPLPRPTHPSSPPDTEVQRKLLPARTRLARSRRGEQSVSQHLHQIQQQSLRGIVSEFPREKDSAASQVSPLVANVWDDKKMARLAAQRAMTTILRCGGTAALRDRREARRTD